MQNSFFTIDNQGMTGVVSSLITHYELGFVSQQIDNFTLSFVTPLGAQDNDALTHFFLSEEWLKKDSNKI